MEFIPHSSPRTPHYLRRDRTLKSPIKGKGSIAAALFDFDGTLVESEAPSAAAFAKVAESLGASFSDDEALSLCYGRSWHDAFMDTAKVYPELMGQRDNFVAVMRDEIERAGGFLGEPILPSLTALRRISERMPVAVVSGSFRANLITSLKNLGVSDCVTTVVGAEDYSAGKPNPEPFLIAAKELGVAPHQCVVFEDSDVGILAAQSAGMKCIALRSEGQQVGAANMTVSQLDTRDVLDFLSKPTNVSAT